MIVCQTVREATGIAMESKFWFKLVIVTVLINSVLSKTRNDFYVGRTFVPREATILETFEMMRASTSVIQQILYIILTPIQSLITVILGVVCSSTTIAINFVDSIRSGVFGSITTVLAQLNLFPSVLLLSLTRFVNVTISNITTFVLSKSCLVTSSTISVVDSLVDAVIGIF